MGTEMLLADPGATATFSPDGRYRYTLTREWNRSLPRILWIMLNPSTATEFVLDPTIKRCVSFSGRWGYGSLDVVNLFALRATDPAELRTVEDPVGPGNDEAIRGALGRAAFVVAAWGTKGAYADRNKAVVRLLLHKSASGPRGLEAVGLHCLSVTADGHPEHPLYVPGATSPVAYDARKAMGIR